MSIKVNFGAFRSHLVGRRQRNNTKSQHSSKLNMQMIEKNYAELNERLEMLDAATSSGMLKNGSPEVQSRMDSLPDLPTQALL